MNNGLLYLIPIPISDSPIEKHIPQEVYKVIGEVDVFLVENLKTTRRYLRKLDKTYPIDDKIFHVVDKKTSLVTIQKILAQNKGKTFGVISEAGCPAIADPGADVVNAAHKLNIKVVPMVGPSSILLALIGSGKNGQTFTFNGYLPIDRGERVKKIKSLESLAKKGHTQIFMETPFRNNHLLEDVLINCDNNMELCIASNINAEDELIKTLKISDWKKNTPDLHKKPTIFVL